MHIQIELHDARAGDRIVLPLRGREPAIIGIVTARDEAAATVTLVTSRGETTVDVQTLQALGMAALRGR
ncbi:MAG: hypothetical protein ACTH0V_05215 [Microbacteriaceae bacterium]